MQTPKFLRDLLQSNKYWNKNSAEFAKANEYLEKLFPGELQQDATGQYIEPKYDMTYEQFLDAQKKFDYDIQNAIQEAEAEAEAENDILVDYSQFVEIDEEIDVRVLMPWGDIQNEKLIVYTLNIPDDDDEEHTEAKKQIQTAVRYEKRDTQKKLNVGTFKNLQKFQIGVLGDVSEVKSERRAPVCAIKPQSEKRKGRKQPKRNKNGVANPSNNKTM